MKEAIDVVDLNKRQMGYLIAWLFGVPTVVLIMVLSMRFAIAQVPAQEPVETPPQETPYEEPTPELPPYHDPSYDGSNYDESLLPPEGTEVTFEVEQQLEQELEPILPVTEASLLAKIHEINRKEIQMGEMAKENGADSIAKRYGHRIASDHRFMERRVLDLAEDLQMDLGAAVLPLAEVEQNKHNSQISTLSSVTGDSFDGAFFEMMEEGHREAIASLNDGRNQLPVDSKVRIFAGRVVPILQQHLDVVSRLQGR